MRASPEVPDVYAGLKGSSRVSSSGLVHDEKTARFANEGERGPSFGTRVIGIN